MSAPNADSNSGRTRSFGGCSTCRIRRFKCDESRPACSMCKAAGVVCGGYEKSIFFDFEDAPESGTLRFRRPLLTEEERKAMSNWLITAVPFANLNRHLLEIEEKCDNVPTSQALQVSRGPFGVFRVVSSLSQSSPHDEPLPSTPWPEPSGVITDAVNEKELTQRAVDDCIFVPDDTLPSDTQELVQAMFDDFRPLPAFSSPCIDILDLEADSVQVQDIFEGEMMAGLLGLTSAYDSSIPSHGSYPPDLQVDHSIISDSSALSSPIDISLPQDAVFLLKHYQATILQLLTPFKHSKTPWHILFIPHAKNCLAALTLGDTIDDASLCSFYGTLAVSAFSLWGISNVPMWLDRGHRYKQQARHHVRKMLQTAYDVPKKAKYKSILMALLTMVQLSMVTGNRDQTECYFLETEKFIRLRGLNRRKSRKVRLLHHCYAFERILHESTVVGVRNTSHRLHVSEAVRSSGLIIYGQDSMSFQLGKWEDLAQEMMQMKGQDKGENDLHLEYPGIWSSTLYPEIFGVSENWIFLVSLVIRLGREKHASEQEGATTALSAKEFLSRAKALEKCIMQLSQTRKSSGHNHQMLDFMLDAMEHALLIYFYRRIYDVDSSILQHRVLSVRDCLLQCGGGDPEQVFGTARLVWPVFIAASEAEDPEVQASFATWFQDAAQRSGLSLFSDTMENLQRVWREKAISYGSVDPWPETLMETVIDPT